MFEKGMIVTINNRVGVVVRTGKELTEELVDELDDHTGVWLGTLDGGLPEIKTIPTEYLDHGPLPVFKH